jgi:hypothetical protein
VSPEIGKIKGGLKFCVSLPIEQMRSREINMEIAPIPGIRVLSAMQGPQGDFRLPEVFNIEGAARPGDGERQRGGRKASGAEENEEDDLTLEAEAESGADTREELPARSVDYFA